MPNERTRTRELIEIAAVFSRLGCSSFGGPIAHLSYFHAEIVRRRNWLDDAHYGDLVALCQCLPGPASSQAVFALGMHRAGLAGALLASTCFTLPSALLMIAFARGAAAFDRLHEAGWLHGLKLAAVAIVAQAVWSMGKKLCVDRASLSLCLVTAAVQLSASTPITQVAAIAFGGLCGFWVYRTTGSTVPSAEPQLARQGRSAAYALAVFAALLALLPALASVTPWLPLQRFDSFYRSGALVFGGGHVVLPLLRAEIVPRGWLTDDQFLAGYAAAQAVPGPLFSFAAYLGAAMAPGVHAISNGFFCLFAIFLPAFLLVGGALPFWHRLRASHWAQAALRGANASVVGVLLAALYDPVFSEGVHDTRDAAAALLAFGLLEYWHAPPWLIVLGLAGVGQWLHAA